MRFVDTNILVYAEQPGAGAKHAAAIDLLRDLWNQRDGAVSAQVLQEFYVNVTKKGPSPYPPDVAKRIVSLYLAWKVVPVDEELVLDAIEIQLETRLSYWDAAIVAASIAAGATQLLTEDLSDRQVIRGVRIVNPLPT
jgi:predicted nucleic acid-binding protein